MSDKLHGEIPQEVPQGLEGLRTLGLVALCLESEEEPEPGGRALGKYDLFEEQ